MIITAIIIPIIQLFWFIHLIVDYIEVPLVGSGIRFDRAFNPFYEKDVKEGKTEVVEEEEEEGDDLGLSSLFG